MSPIYHTTYSAEIRNIEYKISLLCQIYSLIWENIYLNTSSGKTNQVADRYALSVMRLYHLRLDYNELKDINIEQDYLGIRSRIKVTWDFWQKEGTYADTLINPLRKTAYDKSEILSILGDTLIDQLNSKLGQMSLPEIKESTSAKEGLSPLFYLRHMLGLIFSEDSFITLKIFDNTLAQTNNGGSSTPYDHEQIHKKLNDLKSKWNQGREVYTLALKFENLVLLRSDEVRLLYNDIIQLLKSLIDDVFKLSSKGNQISFKLAKLLYVYKSIIYI